MSRVILYDNLYILPDHSSVYQIENHKDFQDRSGQFSPVFLLRSK